MRKIAHFRDVDLLELSRALLEDGKSVRFQAKGRSMHPFIQDGDIITVSPVENSSINIGDVVLYSPAEDTLIVHRVINKYTEDNNLTMLIKGDASFGSPESVNSQRVLGKIVSIERNGRERKLDTSLYRIIGLFLAAISPFRRWTCSIGGKAKYRGHRLLAFAKYQSIKWTNNLKKG